MVLTAPNDIKISCLEELGTGWLVQAITGELRDFSHPPKERSQASTPIGMGTPNAAGEQVDLLNAVDEPSMDLDDVTSSSDDEDDETMADSIGSLRRPRQLRFTTTSQIRARLKAIKDTEQDPRLRAERDDLRIQEQALDFIRNLIAESKSGACEMIDHLLSTIGAPRFFEIIASKLRPKGPAAPPQPFGTTASTSSPAHNRSSHPGLTAQPPPPQQVLAFPPHHHAHPFAAHAPPEILLAALFILIHIANGRPSHRSLLISQTALLTHILPLFQHPDRRMRVACVWLINNLTWMDDSSDAANARQRAMDLRALGIEERVRLLMQDQDLDTRERAKTAAEQMGKLLEGVEGAAGGIGGGVGAGLSGGLGGGLSSGLGLGGMHRSWRGGEGV